jgi:hypothetical protein
VLLPALSYAKEDRQRGLLTDADVQEMVQATREIVEDLATDPSAAAPDGGAMTEEDGAARVPWVLLPLLGCPARDDIDALAMRLLQQACDPTRAAVDLLPPRLLPFDVIAPVAETVELLRADGCDHIGTTLQTTRDHIMHVCQLVASQRALRPEGGRDGPDNSVA